MELVVAAEEDAMYSTCQKRFSNPDKQRNLFVCEILITGSFKIRLKTSVIRTGCLNKIEDLVRCFPSQYLCSSQEKITG